jgi:hypothetical protein
MENKMTNQLLQAALQSVKNIQEGGNKEKLIEDLSPMDEIVLRNELIASGFVEEKDSKLILMDKGEEKLNQLKNGKT